MRSGRFTTLFAALTLAACNGSTATVEHSMSERIALNEISDAEWDALASRRIFFGHQSVGRDIVDGMRRVLDANPYIGLRVVTADHPSLVAGPAFIEARIGRNREPASKTQAFEAVLDAGFGAEPGAIALYKYCYVDVLADTDPDALFAAYARSIDDIRARHPALTIVHVTMPLQVADDGIVERLKTATGAPTQTRLNHARGRYNALLREHYGARDPIFDLAAIESTRPDGSRAYTRYRGEAAYMLAPEYTYDGGHLNEAAQDHVARALLAFLARLEQRVVAEHGSSHDGGMN